MHIYFFSNEESIILRSALMTHKFHGTTEWIVFERTSKPTQFQLCAVGRAAIYQLSCPGPCIYVCVGAVISCYRHNRKNPWGFTFVCKSFSCVQNRVWWFSGGSIFSFLHSVEDLKWWWCSGDWSRSMLLQGMQIWVVTVVLYTSPNSAAIYFCSCDSTMVLAQG